MLYIGLFLISYTKEKVLLQIDVTAREGPRVEHYLNPHAGIERKQAAAGHCHVLATKTSKLRVE